MVRSARHISSDTLKNPYVVTKSLRALVKDIHLRTRSIKKLEEGLYDIASAKFAPGSVDFLRQQTDHVVDDFETQLIAYLGLLIKSPAREFIKSPQDLFDDFAWYLTQPLRLAEKDTITLEGEVLSTLSRHPAMALTDDAFVRDLQGAAAMLVDYQGIVDDFTFKVSSVHRRIRVIEKIFVDPERVCLKMRALLHDISNVLAVQSGAVQGILRFKNSPRDRARWIESLHYSINETLNPFHYIQKTYPQVRVAPPRYRYDFPHPDIVCKILHHFIQNALAAGAERISLQVVPPLRANAMLTIAVLDDGPGIPSALLPKLGRTIIAHKHRQDGGSGLYLVRHELLPQLGAGANFAIESPLQDGRGTIVKLMLPAAAGGTAPAPVSRRGNDERTAPVEPASSTKEFGLPVGLAPMRAAPPALDNGAGLTRSYDVATSGAMGCAGVQTTTAISWHLSIIK